ncbi:MAG TPA: hypothetical protein DHW82_04140 [Spirochaetia bacterium]|nr:MAG: hypothetical protein A2Y41_01925 [Spirochaetes bacterium GWB1_36_13]HCL56183.1 hypothetical protein [Spirochaetia bacterium]
MMKKTVLAIMFLLPFAGYAQKIQTEIGVYGGGSVFHYLSSQLVYDKQFASIKTEAKAGAGWTGGADLAWIFLTAEETKDRFFLNSASVFFSPSWIGRSYKISQNGKDYDFFMSFLGLEAGARAKFLKIFTAGIGGFIHLPISSPKILDKTVSKEHFKSEIGILLEAGAAIPLFDEFELFGGLNFKLSLTKFYENKTLSSMNLLDNINDTGPQSMMSEILWLKAGIKMKVDF